MAQCATSCSVTVPEYTVLAAASVIAAVAFDLLIVRTRVMLTAAFWVSLGIMWSFQVLVDGWLTKKSSPIVLYNENEFSGRRIFFDSPIEDFAFALAMIVLTLSVWERIGQRRGDRS
jgi:lycopene cyclase domain-containing protein